ncbi:DNA repair protein rad51 3-like [Trifolium pratense]|uniref:DNA repair protein rad51 3-like n=1 Tax=Trifolium pratense TaxID=57577 RepID=A0A2K3M272_TRIPR|nr:DNA repair protein rad51 3-like [Trifolium pratense]
MEIGMLPISASKRGKLLAAGYTTLHSIATTSITHLATDIEVSESEALEILNFATRNSALERSSGSNTNVIQGMC